MSKEAPSRSDRMNPIVVRQMRRLVRSHTFTWTTILVLALTIVAIGASLALMGTKPVGNPLAQFWNAAAIGPAQFFIYFASIAPAVMLVSNRIKDELLDLPFSSNQLLHGYMLLGVLLAGYYAALALPFMALASFFGGDPAMMTFGVWRGVFSGIVTNLVFLSFLAKIRNNSFLIGATILLFFFSSMPFMVLGFVEAAISMRAVFASITSSTHSTAPPMAMSPITQNDPRFLVFVFVMWAVFGVLAYLLCRNHLAKPKRNPGMDITMNLVVYGVFTAFMSLLWAALRLSGLIV